MTKLEWERARMDRFNELIAERELEWELANIQVESRARFDAGWKPKFPKYCNPHTRGKRPKRLKELFNSMIEILDVELPRELMAA